VAVTLASTDVLDTAVTEHRVPSFDLGSSRHNHTGNAAKGPAQMLPGVECAVDVSILVAVLLAIAAVVRPIFRGNGL
jgi:hypothetical protein